MNLPAAIYARVSSDRQKENHTITSQTAALKEYAQTHDYLVPTEWVFEDEGYSGATLVRPGLEALRDLAARGEIQTVLVYSPDRLSRKYAYQVLLAEELQRCGVSLVFLKAPAGETAEDRLLEQFQGMIAEYERAQILERSRRGKRHKAQAGVVSVLSGAPYGYRYIKKSDTAEACFEVIEAEAEVVHTVFDLYTREGLSINAIARHLNQQQIATRRGDTRWERSTVWALLRNPAYQGKACYGKTEIQPRQRITRPLRQRNRLPARNSASHERPRQDWIEIAVPALVNEETFAFAQEQLEKNRHYSRRRTIQPTLLQGMLVCRDCGYALYRTSTRTSARKLYYYRCLGSDAYRHLRGASCANRPVRADYLDEFVWREIIRLLEEPALVQAEIDRRLAEAQIADPLHQREQNLRNQQVRLRNVIERLLTAYQEELLSLEQLRQRMPALRKQQQAVDADLRSLALAAADQSLYLRLTETLADFCTRLHARADALGVTEKQKIARLLVHEILVGKDIIVIRHSIPLLEPEPDRSGLSTGPATTSTTRSAVVKAAGYLLGPGRNFSLAGEHLSAPRIRRLDAQDASERAV
jgi:site-specific DNA recombinase